MPSKCCVFHCRNYAKSPGGVSLYRFPKVKKNASEEKRGLLKTQRLAWCKAVRPKGITDKELDGFRVCSDHFISGKPAKYYDVDNPDWEPQLKLAYRRSDSCLQPKFDRYLRAIQPNSEKCVEIISCQPDIPELQEENSSNHNLEAAELQSCSDQQTETIEIQILSFPEIELPKYDVTSPKDMSMEANKHRGKNQLLAELLKEERQRRSQLAEENSALKHQLEQVTKDAELSEFLHYIRGQISQFEMCYCEDFPSKDDYVKTICDLAQILPSQISDDLHFQRWLWILVTVDEICCKSLVKLRQALNNDVERYVWFAHQMEVMNTVISEDVPTRSPFRIRHMKKANYQEYTKFFAPDIRIAVQQFIQCTLV